VVITLAAVWPSRYHETWSSGETTSTWSFLPGGLVSVTESHSAHNVGVRWGWLVAFLVTAYVFARCTAAFVERATHTVLSPLRWLLSSIATTVLIAAILAAAWSRSYWGYWFTRPAADASWWSFDGVDAFSAVLCQREVGGYRCEVQEWPVAKALEHCSVDEYECTAERLPLALATSRLLPSALPALNRSQLSSVASLLQPSNLERSEKRYDGNRVLGGFAAFGRSKRGEPQLALALSGGEISNDHHPSYEFVAQLTPHGAHLVRHRKFFYDIAGMEGFEFSGGFIALSLIGISLGVPLTLGAMVTVALRRSSS